MSRFGGYIESTISGNRTYRSGTIRSGQAAGVSGRSIGVEVEIKVEGGVEIVRVYRTPGYRGSWDGELTERRVLAEFTKEHLHVHVPLGLTGGGDVRDYNTLLTKHDFKEEARAKQRAKDDVERARIEEMHRTNPNDEAIDDALAESGIAA